MTSREYKQEEYLAKFGYPHCPHCGENKVRENVRTKGNLTYKVYICDRCKYVIGRKIC
jgi:predicted RNA-binding Zn-ribbon protein involved in translation (DUF1610 family)